LPCNNECKLGCNGTGVYECNECRSFKLKLIDLNQIVRVLAEKKYDIAVYMSENNYNQKQIDLASRLMQDIIENEKSDIFKDAKTENLFKLLKSYQDYYSKKELHLEEGTFNVNIDEGNLIFCVNECPVQMPYQTNDFFCSRERNLK
jgi:hypothetical protein